MDKRFQVFVSSTYTDLKEERSRVIQTLLEMDCIPAGMELFPAADEEQWSFIKKIIDDCDYYLLIIGGRYGSTGDDGLSYTEKEYDYAVSKGIKVIAVLRENPDDLPAERSELDPEIRARLTTFREKVATGRLVKFWSKTEDLAGLVSLSLNKTIKMYPAVGWVRADKVSNEELLTELNELRKENSELKKTAQEFIEQSQPRLEGLASLDEKFPVHGSYYSSFDKRRVPWNKTVTWAEIFSLIAPYIMKASSEDSIDSILGRTLMPEKHGTATLADQVFQTIKIQLMALGLIQARYSKTTSGNMAWFWTLTPAGFKLLMESRTIKTKK
jgi:hypothetical protein